jgi:UDP:flavonoid glycosyltransferase YjiC (YdhE family)
MVFTTGTGVYDVEAFFQHARGCCRRLGRRGLFLSPHLTASAARAGEASILQVDYLELGLVLPRACLLVHHGGIGTLARAVEAGIPQIVSPLKYDQFDNAHRVEELGLGARLERASLSAGSLAAVAERLLGNGWPGRRVHECREQMLHDDGVAGAATLLERLAAPRGVSRAVEPAGTRELRLG